MQRRASANHHRHVRTDSEEAEDNVVEGCSKHSRPSFDVAGGKRLSWNPCEGGVLRSSHAPALVALPAAPLDVGEVPGRLDLPFVGNWHFRDVERDEEAALEEEGAAVLAAPVAVGALQALVELEAWRTGISRPSSHSRPAQPADPSSPPAKGRPPGRSGQR